MHFTKLCFFVIIQILYMWNALSIEAPCKINLHLRIKGLRGDGFHDLESVFLALAYGDTLHFDIFPGGGGGVELEIENGITGAETTGLENLPPEKNIVCRAAALFRERTGFDRPLKIRLEKRIPPGAGLGGGSSDGAAVLLALNAAAGAALTAGELRKLAEQLGSDVPFFLSPGAAFVSGRGECIRPIPVPGDFTIILVYPGFGSNTAEAYRLLDTYRAKSGAGSAKKSPAELSEAALVEALGTPPSRWPYRNDFLEVFLEGENTKTHKFYATIPQALRALGADFSGLTGSGSVCFGVFTGEGIAKEAIKSLSSLDCLTVPTFPLAHCSFG
jgi:4-diphosphocytidyl-2-C-methyl-D-erythritol kinase